MKRILLLSMIIMTGASTGFSQDTIYTNNNKIICSVKEITTDGVKFTYPNEDLTNTIYKNVIQKIVFHSGRVQTFAEASSYKQVNGPKDYENVTLTRVESEVQGLFKVGDVSSKAKGTTDLSNQERVKDRALRKMKIEAAMMGANIVYVTDVRTQGNKMGTKYESGQSAEASMSGVAYTTVLPDFNNFQKLIEGKTFTGTQIVELWSSGSDMNISAVTKPMTIGRVYNDGGLIYINADVKGIKNNTFRVVSFTDNSFILVYNDKSSIYNLTVTF